MVSSTAASNCEDDSKNNCDNEIIAESPYRYSHCNIIKLLDQFEPVYASIAAKCRTSYIYADYALSVYN
jgi:hypothetical protein